LDCSARQRFPVRLTLQEQLLHFVWPKQQAKPQQLNSSMGLKTYKQKKLTRKKNNQQQQQVLKTLLLIYLLLLLHQWWLQQSHPHLHR
jgi:hypothetical protein